MSVDRLFGPLVYNKKYHFNDPIVALVIFKDCPIEPCPTCSIEGFWVQPMLGNLFNVNFFITLHKLDDDTGNQHEFQTGILLYFPSDPAAAMRNYAAGVTKKLGFDDGVGEDVLFRCFRVQKRQTLRSGG